MSKSTQSAFVQDQAAGLRRIMATPAPRLIAVISANNSDDQSRLMTNLAASLANQATKTLLIHASKTSSERVYNINMLPTLLDQTQRKLALTKALHLSEHGFTTAKLMQKSQLLKPQDTTILSATDALVKRLSNTYEVVLVDTCVDSSGRLPLSAFNDGQIIIKLNQGADSIKQAYAQIKRLHSQLDKHQFGIMVEDASEQQAQQVFQKIDQVSQTYLQVSLNYFGAIPKDEQLSKATQLGRTVIDAFPFAKASKAFTKMAMQFDYIPTQTLQKAAVI